MIRRGFDAVLATWLTGLGILLPLVLTFAALAWVFSLVNRLLGPGSLVGGLFAAIGYPFTSNPDCRRRLQSRGPVRQLAGQEGSGGHRRDEPRVVLLRRRRGGGPRAGAGRRSRRPDRDDRGRQTSG